MAGSQPLKHAALRLAALVVAVVLLHMAALEWMSRHLDAMDAALKPLPPPMFTRLLQPQAPPPVPVAQAETPPLPKPRRAVARTVPTPPERPASQPQVTAQPDPVTAEPAVPPVQEQVAQKPPEPAASAASAPAATTSASLDSWPSDTRLNYRLGGQFRSGELYGDARVQWQRDGERYQVRIDINVTLFATLVLTSQGEVTAQGLFPRDYEELRRSGPRRARLGDDSVTLADGRVLPRPRGAQDTASQFVELAHRFATGQEVLEVGRSVDVWLARPGGVDLWTYDIVEREMLQTQGLGVVEAFRLKPRPITKPRGPITAEMWFAPSLQYLPVRIRVSMGDGTFVDLMVEKIEQR
ncbi:MAG: DUF3108 domain-containing protein [Ramlibacter sp.]|nr:DUF3108 domain-containing protein [Ramlibacter sp.]